MESYLSHLGGNPIGALSARSSNFDGIAEVCVLTCNRVVQRMKNA
jgi:hypothetical protein